MIPRSRIVGRGDRAGLLLQESDVKLDVYEHLAQINAGFDQAIRSLIALRKHGAFPRGTLARFTALSKETRAATISFLAGMIEAAETAEAGRRFRERRAQESADEQGQ